MTCEFGHVHVASQGTEGIYNSKYLNNETGTIVCFSCAQQPHVESASGKFKLLLGSSQLKSQAHHEINSRGGLHMVPHNKWTFAVTG